MFVHNKFTAAAANPRNAGTCGIYDVAGKLGQAHRLPSYITKLIAELIADRSFPPPLPGLCNGHLTDKVTRDSRWITDQVDLWFEHIVPAALRPAAAAVKAAQKNDVLAERARSLQ